MAISRSAAVELARLLESAGEPIYVLDDQARIVYCNRACAAWLNCDPGQLIGQTCQYHSTTDAGGAASLAAALCPPPEVLAGRPAIVKLLAPTPEGRLASRPVEFRPLHGESGEPAGVLAIVLAPAEADASQVAAAEESAHDLHRRIQRYRNELELRFHVDRLVGDSPVMQRIRAQVRLAAGSLASVLLVGPAGSGRQHVARAIHYTGTAASGAAGALVPLACSLLGAELLQTTIRALTRPKGAVAPSTLLLNDVDQLPPEAQSELAGFLLAAELPMRIVSTSREPLSAVAQRGAIRADLAAVLGTLTIELPPLRERLHDFPLIAQWMLEDANARGAKQLGGFSLEALDRMTDYAWPGDIAELGELVRQVHATADGPEISARDLPRRILLAGEAARHAPRPEEKIVLDEYLGRIERELIERALSRARGNKTKAAELLGMTRPRLYRRLVQLGLEEAAPEERC